MRKIIYFGMAVLFVLSLAACSGESNSRENSAGADESKKMMASDSAELKKKTNESAESTSTDKQTTINTEQIRDDRMVIYNADMSITVNGFEKARNQVESLVKETGGYIVQSSTAQTEEEKQRGSVTARIPQPEFNLFLDQIEKVAENVEHRTVNGRDVTEEYVDLESRLNAKTAVQKRLQTFLENAKNTEDLLKISEDLAKVQEEIEQIKGSMQYLENQSAYSTVTVQLSEENASLKQGEDLNTWERTKQMFINTVNGLLSFFSFLVVFLVGFSPAIILIAVITAIAYFIYRRKHGDKL